MRNILKISLFSALFLLPSFAFANVEITEVMYDPKGADSSSGGEWIEIHNTEPTPIDLTKWIFFENETNHSISTEGNFEVSADGYAVISRDITAFEKFYTSYSGLLFKASFSLNESESLVMKNGKEDPAVDTNPYSSDKGGKDDGNSLQKINGTWKAEVPTPGKQNESVQESSSQKTETPAVSSQNSESSGNSGSTYDPYDTQFLPITPIVYRMTAYAGESRTTVVGSRVVLNGESRGSNGEDLPFAKYSWNTGDGNTAEGKTVEYSYDYPGEYIVTLDVVNGMYNAQSRVAVTVSPVDVVISKVGTEDSFVEIKNNTKSEVDLSGWVLSRGGVAFVFPKGTYIRAGKGITVPSRVTKFVAGEIPTYLSYADGTKVSVFGKELVVEKVTPKTSSGLVGLAKVLSKINIPPVPFEESPILNEDEKGTSTQQMASVGNVSLKKETDNGMFWGLVGVSLIILVAMYAVLESQEKGFPAREKAKKESEKYTILDIES
jgi:hypothetical protein